MKQSFEAGMANRDVKQDCQAELHVKKACEAELSSRTVNKIFLSRTVKQDPAVGLLNMTVKQDCEAGLCFKTVKDNCQSQL